MPPKQSHTVTLNLSPQDLAKIPQQIPSIVHNLNLIDPLHGWPPVVNVATSIGPVIPQKPEATLDSITEDTLRKAAMSNPEVKTAIGDGRWEYFGAHQIADRASEATKKVCANLSFYNYSSQKAINVLFDDGKITDIKTSADYLPPESPNEIKQAISLAQSDSRIKNFVSGLDAHAILQSPVGDHPLAGKRVLWVIFSEKDDPTVERKAEFTAIVNITDQKVEWAGAAPCNNNN